MAACADEVLLIHTNEALHPPHWEAVSTTVTKVPSSSRLTRVRQQCWITRAGATAVTTPQVVCFKCFSTQFIIQPFQINSLSEPGPSPLLSNLWKPTSLSHHSGYLLCIHNGAKGPSVSLEHLAVSKMLKIQSLSCNIMNILVESSPRGRKRCYLFQ